MQPELFRNLEAEFQTRKLRPPLFPQRFVRVRMAYEDLIFASLGLVLVLLAGFCLGVERGKRLSAADVRPAQAEEVASSKKEELLLPPAVPFRSEANRTVRSEGPRVVSQSEQEQGGKYAIQLASYVSSQAAQAEALRLRRQGFNGQVVKQGRYFELRVVGYRLRTEAMVALTMLKKTYHDGFIKRLSSG